MAYKGCKKCTTSPSIKCQRCKNHFCDDHSAKEGRYRDFTPIECPFLLCHLCYLEFWQWRLTSTWKYSTKLNLCCIVNGQEKCPLCLTKFCDKHRHTLNACLAWIKWKRSPRIVAPLTCCLQAKLSGEAERCPACRYPNCGSHKIKSSQAWYLYTCQLCGYQG